MDEGTFKHYWVHPGLCGVLLQTGPALLRPPASSLSAVGRLLVLLQEERPPSAEPPQSAACR